MRLATGLCMAAIWLPLWAGSARAAGVSTQDITLQSGDEEIKAFLAVPEGKGPFPAIVVIQEWWGLTDWIKDNAKRLAAQGYVALAPDLYRGKVGATPQQARQLMSGMPQDRALRDLKAAADALAARTDVDKSRLGVIGWCMGGGLALQLALHDSQIKACAMCYGRVVTKAEQLKGLQAAILGIFAEKDQGIPPKQVRQFEAALKQDQKPEEIHIFEGAGHGFMRPVNNPAYKADAAKEAWQHIDQFFAKTLKKG